MRPLAICLTAAAMFVVTNVCCAELLITLTQSPLDRVEISFNGSGTAGGASPFQTFNDLDFRDFFDAFGLSPFASTITFDGSGDGRDYALLSDANPLTLTIRPGAVDEIVRTFESIRIDREFVGGSGVSSDFSLLGSGTPLSVGDAYEASGSATVDLEQLTGGGTSDSLEFSDLNPGTYVFSGSADADVFGSVTLQIVATSIPEPSAVLFGSLVCGVISIRARPQPCNPATMSRPSPVTA